MSHKRNLRIVLAMTITAIAAIGSPTDRRGSVCNEAGNGHHDGTYVATDNDPSKPARYQDGLTAMSHGKGTGRERAAANSPALSQRSPPVQPPQFGGGGDGGVIN